MTDKSSREIFIQTLSSVLGERSRVALLDIPTVANPGDHAIWLGERMALKYLGINIVLELDDKAFKPEIVRRALGEDGVILLQGGGSFGDLYAARQSFRHQVLTEFSDVPIIHMPQSIHIQRSESLAQLQEDIGRHSDFTLLVRDSDSYERATCEFDCPTYLTTDAASAILHNRSIPKATHDILWIRRRDIEAANVIRPPTSENMLVSDWAYALSSPVRNRRDSVWPVLQRELRKHDNTILESLRQRIIPLVPNSSWQQSIRFLAQGRVIITERLHGHILGRILNIPTVLIDNRIGKLGNYWRTWSSTYNNSTIASNPEEALELAADFLQVNRRE